MARRHPSPVRVAVGSLALGAGAGTIAVVSAGLTASVLMARSVVTPPTRRREPLRVIAVDREAGTITLPKTLESTAAGTYSLVYGGSTGRALLGPIVSSDLRSVTRQFGGEDGAPLERGVGVRVASAPQRGPDDLHVPWSTVDVETELGPAPAWLFPATTDDGDWAVHVHGRAAVMTEPLRSIQAFHEAGWTSLVVSYRNDPGAPRSIDGRFGLGYTEWRDVDAAMRLAVSRGARRIILVGWSMGGATVLQTFVRSSLRDRVVGLFLESPVVSWNATLRHQGRLLHMPRWVTKLAIRLISSPLAPVLVGLGEPIPLAELEMVRRAADIDVPVLLLHSVADKMVPARPSAELGRRSPARVRYEEFPTGLHTRLWNVDAARWERVLREWLRQFSSSERDAAGSSRSSATSRE